MMKRKSAEKPKKTPKSVLKNTSKNLKVPIFSKAPKVPKLSRFRMVLALSILGLFVLVGSLAYVLTALPRATIVISSNTKALHKTLDVTFDTTADTVDAKKMILPSIVEQLDRTSSKTVPTTGTRNDGQHSTGFVEFSSCADNPNELQDIPSGTVIVADENANTQAGEVVKYFTTQAVAQFDYVGPCVGKSLYRSNQVAIESRDGGTKQNIHGTSDFKETPNLILANISTSGGTDKIIKVVSQKDIDGLKNSVGSVSADSVTATLRQRLQEHGLFAVPNSVTTRMSSVITNATAGQAATELTGTRKTTFKMVGVKRADLQALITKVMEHDIDKSKQAVIETGIDRAIFMLKYPQDEAGKVLMSIDVTSMIGPRLDEVAVKKDIAGMKAIDAEELVRAYPTVSDARVYFEPFWVTTIPSNPHKITIKYDTNSK
ncbi:MAG TPA: hypothetical protein VG992_01675 [Candidatus Saccharimonadales bacterium]|nr:hypothetical protein [Candidatus Saccharimonadales bacterium]